MQRVLIFTFTLAAIFLGSAAYAQDTRGYVEGRRLEELEENGGVNTPTG